MTQLAQPSPDALGNGRAKLDAGVYLSMAVHELRAPATVMIGVAETLRTALDTDDFDRHAPGLLDALVRNGRHMAALIDDLLSTGYLDHGVLPLRIARVPLLPILRWAVEAVGVADDTVTIDCDAAVHADVDPDRFEQMVVNLVSNALRHGAPPVHVSVRVVAGGDVVLVVRDHGAGVDRDDSATLFDRFSMLSGRAKDSTGLGLSITRGIARAMGGDVVYQRADPGSRFVVTLPMGGTAPRAVA